MAVSELALSVAQRQRQEHADSFSSDHHRGLGRHRQRGGRMRRMCCEVPKPVLSMDGYAKVMKLQPWSAGFFILYLHV